MTESDIEHIVVRDNPAESRYESRVGDEVAVLEYERDADKHIALIHTEVPSALEGRGIASKIVRFALDDARARGLEVIPICPYVVSYLRRHPDDLDVVAPNARYRVTNSKE